MHKTPSLSSLLHEQACRQRKRIGIGVTAPTEPVIEGLRRARSFCEPVLYGAEVPGFSSHASSHPEEALFNDLANGVIDGAVRGQLSPHPFRVSFERLCDKEHSPTGSLVTVLEFPGEKAIIVSPPSNLITGTFEEKVLLAEASIEFCRLIGLPVSIGVLAQCRREDLSYIAGTEFERCYQTAEQLVTHFKERCAIKNYEIDFEKAYQDGVTILIEPNGTTGNQVIRTLYFLGAVRFFGGPYIGAKHVVVETFKNAADFPDVLMLTAALCNCRDTKEKGCAP